MPLTDQEFTAILADESKAIQGDVTWSEDEDHSPSVEFRAAVETEAGWPLFVKGSYNRLIGALSYVLILRTEGRIYALDLGKDHRNLDGERTGPKHKHTWSEASKAKHAYVPDDITADATDPVAVWEQFLREARIRHHGIMHPPPREVQDELWP